MNQLQAVARLKIKILQNKAKSQIAQQFDLELGTIMYDKIEGIKLVNTKT